MAAVLRHRPGILTRRLGRVVVAAVLAAAAPADAAPAFLDAVLAAVNGATVTASDVTIARALSLFGLTPSDAPIGPEDVRRVMDGRLIADEALRLQITPDPGKIDEAWRDAAERLGGTEVLRGWLAQSGVDEAWARSLVEADARRRRFIAVRFRAFVYVTEEELTATLGPGPHAREAREAARERLRDAEVSRELAAWIAEARERATIRRADVAPGGVPLPFAMPRSD